jgi:hypothetical protein
MTNERRLQQMIERRDAMQAMTLNVVSCDPWVPMTLSGAEYKLEYSFKAAKEVFRATGRNLFEVGAGDLIDEAVFEAVLVAGMRKHQPSLVADDVLDLVPMRHLEYVRTCIMLALQAQEPDPRDVARKLAEIDERYDEDRQQELPLAEPELGATYSGSGHDAPILEFPNAT